MSKPSTEPSLGVVLRKVRLARGESQAEVARIVGVNRSHLHKIEWGGIYSPNFSLVVRLARHYGLDLYQLPVRDD